MSYVTIAELAALAAFMAAGPLVADTLAGTEVVHHWVCTGGGSLNDERCWMAGEAPTGYNDTAIFDVGGVYTVGIPEEADSSFGRARFRSGLVSIDMTAEFQSLSLGNSNTVQPALVIGESPSSIASVTILSGLLSASHTRLGEVPGSFGMLDLDGPTTRIWAFSECSIGHEGFGVFSLTGGADAPTGSFLGTNSTRAGVTVGWGVEAWGELEIGGAGTSVSMGTVRVGRNGIGYFAAEDGCDVSIGDLFLAQHVAAFGGVEVRGMDTIVEIDGRATVGVYGQGELLIGGGGVVTTTDTMTIGALAEIVSPFPIEWRLSSGEVRVDGATSHVSIGGDLEIGMAGRGVVILADGATVDVAGDLLRGDPPGLAPSEDNRIELLLSNEMNYPTPAVTVGGLSDAFAVRVELLGDYVPVDGDAFHVLSTGLGAGDMTFELPELAPTLAWEIDQTATDVTISVVPGLAGDANGDGQVTIDDIVVVVTNFGPCPEPPAQCPGDVNGDGAVTVDDIVVVVLNFDP